MNYDIHIRTREWYRVGDVTTNSRATAYRLVDDGMWRGGRWIRGRRSPRPRSTIEVCESIGGVPFKLYRWHATPCQVVGMEWALLAR